METKKNYLKPEFEEVEMKMVQSILSNSPCGNDSGGFGN
jgi:hypothetical protein